jgi:hypothetical protein
MYQFKYTLAEWQRPRPVFMVQGQNGVAFLPNSDIIIQENKKFKLIRLKNILLTRQMACIKLRLKTLYRGC